MRNLLLLLIIKHCSCLNWQDEDTQQTEDIWQAVLDDNKDTTQQTEDTWPAVLDDNNRACYLPEDSATSFNAISMLSPSTNANDRFMQPAHKDTCRMIGALVTVVECRTCNREVAGSNLGLGYFAPRSTQPSIPPGSVNKY